MKLTLSLTLGAGASELVLLEAEMLVVTFPQQP